MRTIVYNLLALLLFLGILYIGTSFVLKAYTRHGESITVTDFRGVTVNQLDDYIAGKSLRYKIVDSTYVTDKKPGIVLEQSPSVGEKVKRNRRIYLTINAKVPPKTKLPSLKSSSLKNAKIQLENSGLVLGNTDFEPCIGRNTVNQVLLDGKIMEPGQEIFKGSKIDLILCDGIGNQRIDVPDIIGLTFDEAISVLRMSKLSIGATMTNPDLQYKEDGYVYKQNPAPNSDNKINVGEPVDMYFQKEEVELPEFDYDEEMPSNTEPDDGDDFKDGQVLDFNNLDNLPKELILRDSSKSKPKEGVNDSAPNQEEQKRQEAVDSELEKIQDKMKQIKEKAGEKMETAEERAERIARKAREEIEAIKQKVKEQQGQDGGNDPN